MITLAQHPDLDISKTPPQITARPLSDLPADSAALKALVQAALNVELFTIPLYMCAMTSIQGTHPINAKNISYYKGRVWPGPAPAVIPPGEKNTKQEAYNIIFSVFIDEMLHLQMAANICQALGVKPDFNSPALQDSHYNWICYGEAQTKLPYIIDLRDLDNPPVPSVALRQLDKTQVQLFEVIEESHEIALARIKEDKRKAYFPTVPFANWTAESTENDLPMFGTIGWMYHCIFQYMSLKYTDGTLLWEKLFVPKAGQRDLFNSTAGGARREYPGLPTEVTAAQPLVALAQAAYMMYAICDQGEGGIDEQFVRRFVQRIAHTAQERGQSVAAINAVMPAFQPDEEAVAANSPSYTDTGAPAPSAHAFARCGSGAIDHFSRFTNIQKLVETGEVLTWQQWHDIAGNKWTASMLTDDHYDPKTAPTNIPAPEQVAGALNNLKSVDKAMLDNVAQGAIAGVTTVLTKSWADDKVAFPFPSMVGSGDRMSLFWAVYGTAPTLRQAETAPAESGLRHACQSLALDEKGGSCAAQATYHSCKGSNHCKTEGGCGFVQPVSGGGSCSAVAVPRAKSPHALAGTCGAPTNYSAPADNKCGGLGGCAVPISASQLYPVSGTMIIFDFVGDGDSAVPIGTHNFALGDAVYDTAWSAVSQVRKSRGLPPVEKPAATDLRLALPPST